MNTSVLVIVDIQNDFCSGGALAVPDAEAVLPVVNRLIRGFDRVILTQDWHPPSHVSFASSHPGRAAILRKSDAGEIVLAGLATDYCVLHTALDARALGYEVTVIESGCRGIDVDGSIADAWSQIARAGVRWGASAF